MMDDKDRLDYFNREIFEANESITKQHNQIRWFIILYLVSLFTFFILMGYLHAKNEGNINYLDINEAIIIFVFACLIFILGWLILSALAHKVSMINMLYKHLATLRRNRRQLFSFVSDKEYIYPLRHKYVKLPSLVNFLPYVFFILNYTFLCGSIYFTAYKFMGVVQAFNLSFTSSIIIGLFYPKVCVTFNKHVRAARLAHNIQHKQYIEEKWENIRRSHIKPKSIMLKYSILGLFAIISSIILIAGHYRAFDYACWVYFTVSLTTTIIFAVVRYISEKVPAQNIYKQVERKLSKPQEC